MQDSTAAKRLLYSGKAKDIFASDSPQQVLVGFRDDLTAFNAQKRSICKGKGIYNNHINARLMQVLQQHKIPVAFLEQLDERSCLMRKLDMLPLEFVIRNRAAGSFLEKNKASKKGDLLQPPVEEIYLKDDAAGDPLIDTDYVMQHKLAPLDQVEEGMKLTRQVNQVLAELFLGVGLILVDFKLEFGTQAGRIYLGDEISPDSCRLWDTKSDKNFDKDLFRYDLGDIAEGYSLVAKLLKIDIAPELVSVENPTA